MEANRQPGEPEGRPDPIRKRPRLSMIVILLIAWVVTLMPFLFWKMTWFGNRLTNQQISQYLTDREHPRETQHALVQISDRLSRGDHTVQQFYPQVAALADSPVMELRMTAAWLMGQDNTYEPFHPALLKLVKDAEPLVRWNAALALIRFNDTSGRPALHEMLQPFTVVAPASGILKERLKPGDMVNHGTLIARITVPAAGDPIEVRSPIEGRIQVQLARNGTSIAAGTPLFRIRSGEKDAWEALRGFYLIGQPDDLPDIQPYTHPLPDMPARIQQQARLTVEAIQGRKSGHP